MAKKRAFNSVKEYFYPPPVFEVNGKATGPEAWQESIYYWWWEFLRRHDSYKGYCQNKEYRWLHTDLAQPYQYIGNIHSIPFDKWWKKFGSMLFREPTWRNQFLEIPYSELHRYSTLDHEHHKFLMIPVSTHSKLQLKALFHEYLTRVHPTKPGQRLTKVSRSHFVVVGRPNITALKRLLRIDDFRKSNPSFKQWRIGWECEEYKLSDDDIEQGLDDVIKNRLSARVSNDYNKFDCLVENALRGTFPDYKDYYKLNCSK